MVALKEEIELNSKMKKINARNFKLLNIAVCASNACFFIFIATLPNKHIYYYKINIEH